MRKRAAGRRIPKSTAAAVARAGETPEGKVEAWVNRSPWAYLAASLPILIPCFWQTRIQAGDLGSHVYNAWLAQLIRQGKAPGLALVPQATNVLFDWMLSGLFAALGAAAAQRVAVSCCVLVFVWGAFAFSAAAGQRTWRLMPVIVMLAYGWVFHMGFFNFYLSVGLCFWVLALSWEWKPGRVAASMPLLLAAFLAHGLPVAWTAGVLAYRWLVRHLFAGRKWQLAGLAILAYLAIDAGLAVSMPVQWSAGQAENVVAADQLWVYGDKYWVAALGLLALWCVLAIYRIAESGARPFFESETFQISGLTAAAIFLLPSWISIPGYRHALVYIAERMSVVLGVCLCAVFSAGSIRRPGVYVLGPLVLLFFGMLYADERALNGFEDEVAGLVAALPPGQRVILSAAAPDIRVNALAHTIDRACIGKCYSYANYEPSSGQFRIRVVGPSPIVATTDVDASRMQAGFYTVKPNDVPLYAIVADADGHLEWKVPAAGDRIDLTLWRGL